MNESRSLIEILGPLVRQRVAGLQDQDPEHQHVVVGRAAALRAIRARHRLLELGPERLEIHQRVHPLQVIALRRQLPQPRVNVKQPGSRAMIHPIANPDSVNHQRPRHARVFGGVRLPPAITDLI